MLNDADMTKPQVGGDELAGDSRVFWRAEIQDEGGDVIERGEAVELGRGGEAVDLLGGEVASGHGSFERAGEDGVDQMAVAGKVCGGGHDQALQGGFRDAVGEFGLAGEVLPDGADDAEAGCGGEEFSGEEGLERDQDVGDVGLVDLHVAREVEVVHRVVGIGALGPANSGIGGRGAQELGVKAGVRGSTERPAGRRAAPVTCQPFSVAAEEMAARMAPEAPTRGGEGKLDSRAALLGSLGCVRPEEERSRGRKAYPRG